MRLMACACFQFSRCRSYGALSGRKLEDMMAGARVEVADYKRHPGDFVLWKPSTDRARLGEPMGPGSTGLAP